MKLMGAQKLEGMFDNFVPGMYGMLYLRTKWLDDITLKSVGEVSEAVVITQSPRCENELITGAMRRSDVVSVLTRMLLSQLRNSNELTAI